jgi:hypothetical protein
MFGNTEPQQVWSGRIEVDRRGAEIKIEAERRAGELLAEMAAKGERNGGRGGDRKSSNTMELDDLGVSKAESHRFQQAAAAPANKVREAYAEARATGGDAEAGFLALGLKRRKPDAAA